MCDYSLHHVKSRPAKVGDKLRTVNFNTGTRGFAAPEDSTTAVCVLPGTELAFSEEVKCAPAAFGFSSWRTKTVNFRTAIFRQINKDQPRVHHDALEFPDGTCVLLTELREGQEATVLQLPAQPKTPAEEAAQKRARISADHERAYLELDQLCEHAFDLVFHKVRACYQSHNGEGAWPHNFAGSGARRRGTAGGPVARIRGGPKVNAAHHAQYVIKQEVEPQAALECQSGGDRTAWLAW